MFTMKPFVRLFGWLARVPNQVTSQLTQHRTAFTARLKGALTRDRSPLTWRNSGLYADLCRKQDELTREHRWLKDRLESFEFHYANGYDGGSIVYESSLDGGELKILKNVDETNAVLAVLDQQIDAIDQVLRGLMLGSDTPVRHTFARA